MDILKILSRGTKKAGAQGPADLRKPANKPANPQLYNDPTRGVKRKRTDQQLVSGNEEDEELENVDFFAPKEQKQPIASEPTTKEPTPNQNTSTPLLEQDEVRQVLRSHRLKFTLLSHHEEAQSKIKKSKKKKKKTAPETQAKPKSKDGKRQLFPQPLTSFTELRSAYQISSRLTENLAKQGFRIPTEVQLGSLPILLNPRRAIHVAEVEDLNVELDDGIDFLGVAPTGSGKTLTFLIPTINNVLRSRAESKEKDHSLEAIIVAPTRELAHQIVNEGKKLALGTGVKIVGMKKGMRIPTAENQDDTVADQDSAEGEGSSSDASEEEDESDGEDEKSGSTVTKTDILVTTPLLLLNYLTKGSKSKSLPTVKSLVLDEADVLLDPLFRDQTLGIRKACTGESLRITCWSATMGSNIETIVMEQLKSRASAPLIRLVVGLKDTAVPSVDHKLIYTATEQGKLFAFRQLLHPQSSSDSVPDMRLPFLVFTQSIDRATALHNELKFDIPIQAGGSSRIAALHSSMSENARSSIIARFRAGEIWVLITTDLLMRGIDFRGVNGVVNYDVPTSAAAYVHRVGRTGRAGHAGCVAVTFYTTEDISNLKNIANVIALSEKQAGKAEGEGIPKWLMEALPRVGKDDKKKLKKHGVESRRGAKSKITSKSAWERKKENNKRGAIEGSRKRNTQQKGDADESGPESEWGGLEDN